MWEDVKMKGSRHYKTGGVEPIDLYKSCGALITFCLCNVIKYAFRNLKKRKVNKEDMQKIIHYVEMILEIGDENGKRA